MKAVGILSLAAALVLAQPSIAEEAAPLIAQACAGCHGQSGAGQGATAAIAGYNRDDFLEIWQEFRTSERSATIMNRIARGYTDEEVAVLADYFSSLR